MSFLSARGRIVDVHRFVGAQKLRPGDVGGRSARPRDVSVEFEDTSSNSLWPVAYSTSHDRGL